jgi:adenylate cyclase class 2
MPTEIEAKLKVDNHDAVRRRLNELGGQLISRGLETDTFFDRPDGTLFAKDHGLRVREVEPQDGGERSASLTFKGAVHPGIFKARQEIELSIGSAETACKMLEALGFVQVLRFQKQRERWRLAGCSVELDNLPMIGCHIEIEGPSAGAIQAVREQLVLTGTDPIRTSYIGLLKAYLDKNNLAATEIRFEDE